MQDDSSTLPGSRKRKTGAILLWIGAGVLVLSLAMGAVSGWQLYRTFQAIEGSEPIDGSTTVTLDVGEERTIYRVDQGGASAECVVTGPDGEELALSRDGEVTGTRGETTYVNVGTFTAQSSGAHEVACEGARTLLGPSIDVRWAVGGVFAVIAAIGGVLIAGLLLTVGLIVWLLGRRESREAAARGYGLGYRPG